jgi:hypothetical protein
MENLTPKQNEIISNLVNEFAKINDHAIGSADNIFAHLCDEVEKDEIRIREIGASNIAIREAMNLQMAEDNKKYGDMLREIGLELLPYKDHDNYFQIRHQNGSCIGNGYHDGNALVWKYEMRSDYETILGRSYLKLKGFKVYFNGCYFNDVNEVFDMYIFKKHLKTLLAK